MGKDKGVCAIIQSARCMPVANFVSPKCENKDRKIAITMIRNDIVLWNDYNFFVRSYALITQHYGCLAACRNFCRILYAICQFRFNTTFRYYHLPHSQSFNRCAFVVLVFDCCLNLIRTKYCICP